jgi:hypothetical protein
VHSYYPEMLGPAHGTPRRCCVLGLDMLVRAAYHDNRSSEALGHNVAGMLWGLFFLSQEASN